MPSVLFVCTANLCRSPMAEGVLRTLAAHAGKAEGVEVASAGTHDYHVGEPPFATAVEVAKRRGYQISSCVSRRVTSADFDHFDHILAMDRSNLTNLRSIAPTRSKQKIELLLEYGDKYFGMDVPDPYGGDEKGFLLAMDMIEDGCRGLAKVLLR
jgi:protein-tyrosine phosphatase